jgi:hypothetical protein
MLEFFGQHHCSIDTNAREPVVIGHTTAIDNDTVCLATTTTACDFACPSVTYMIRERKREEKLGGPRTSRLVVGIYR